MAAPTQTSNGQPENSNMAASANPDPAVTPFVEYGTTGLSYFGGYVRDEYLPQLQGPRGMRTYREMGDNSPVVGAIFYALSMLVRQVDWWLEPPPRPANASSAARLVDLVDSALHDMALSWPETVATHLTMAQYGFSISETLFKRRRGWVTDEPNLLGLNSSHDDGLIGWREMAPRYQETIVRWDFDDHGRPYNAIQQAPPNYQFVPIPLIRTVHLTTTAERGNPQGHSCLRSAYRSWWLLKGLEETQAIGFNRDLNGVPKAGVPEEMLSENATAEQKKALGVIERIVRNLRADSQAGVVWPRGWMDDEAKMEKYTLELMSSPGTRRVDIQAAINRYDVLIAMTMLADFLMLGHQRVGSFALGSARTELFNTAVDAFLDVISGAYNNRVIPELVRLNGFNPADAPHLMHENTKATDLGVIGAYVQELAQAGFDLAADPTLLNFLLSRANLPEVPESVIVANRAAANQAAADGQSTAEGGQPVPGPAPEPTKPTSGGRPPTTRANRPPRKGGPATVVRPA